jgi:nicotinamidase-related amidase
MTKKSTAVSPAALLLIDIQNGFLDPVWGQRNQPRFEAAVTRLLAAWRLERRPIFHVRHDSVHPDSPLRPGQAGHAFMPCAAPLAHEPVVGKTVTR